MTDFPYSAAIEDLGGVRDRIESRLQSVRRVGSHLLMAQRVRSRLQVSTWDVDGFAFVFRWGVTLFGVVGGLLDSRAPAFRLRAIVAVGVLAYALLHSFARSGSRRGLAAAVALAIGDVSVYGAAAYFTGLWSSPYAVSVACSVAISGLVGGVWPAVAGLAEVVVFHVVRVELGISTLGPAPFTYKSIGIFAVGALGVCGGQLIRLQRQRATEIDSLRSVNEVHSLLIELHARAADDPRSLTLNGAIQTVVAMVTDEIETDLVTVFIRDPVVYGTERQWQVAAAEGVLLPPVIAHKMLPRVARMAERQHKTLRTSSLASGEGLDPVSTSGLYAPLWGRSDLLGMLVVERRELPPFTESDAGLVDAIASRAGLAIENTQWFARLRQLGAEEERDRIARELHDRIGQSLAGVGLAVDRLAFTLPPEASEFRQEMQSLAEDVRGITRQVRDKLTDLRTTPSAAASLGDVLGEFLERVGARAGLRVQFDHDPVPLLSPAEEHEVWRIAQEAILNAERHAAAKSLGVYWGEESGRRLLIVRDDGKGIAGTAPARRDAYGLIGMRERAEVIGASLRIDTAPGRGTTVSLRLMETRA